MPDDAVRGHDVVPRSGLTEAEFVEARQLVDCCNRCEGLDLALNLERADPTRHGGPDQFLCHSDRRLIGCATVWGHGESEVCLAVHPGYRRRGVGSALLAAAREECRQRHRGSLLLVCEEASRSGQAFVAACGGRYQNAEYRMKLDLARLDAAGSSPADVRLERSRLEDATIVAHILASSFGGSEEQALHRVVHDLARSTHRLYTAWMSGEPIGRLGLVAEGLRVYIIGFAILPEHRNKGYGRAVLAATVRMLFAEGQKDIFLEVATDNLPALALYRSFGFLETTRYGFYRLNVSPGASG